MLFMLSVVY